MPVLAKALGVETVADQAAFMAKELETRYASLDKEIGTASLRLFVALYKGLPYDLTGDTCVPGRPCGSTSLEHRESSSPICLREVTLHLVNCKYNCSCKDYNIHVTLSI